MLKAQKKFSLAIAILVLLTVFAGCSGSPSSSSSQAESAAPSTNPGTSESAASGDTDYPKKAINLIVPYAAGGGTDVNARMLAVQLEEHLGQSVTVINQGGASGSIGTKYALDQGADGYTLLYSAETLGLFQTMQLADYNYNNFIPIAVTVNDPKVLVVAGGSNYQTIEDLLKDIQDRPGKVQMSHTGVGSSGHIQSLVYSKFGYDIAATPFDGGSNAMLAVLGQQVAFTNSNLSVALPYLETGELRALAAFSTERIPAIADVPAITEAVADMAPYVDIPYTPQSLLAPAGTPDAVVAKLREATADALAESEWVAFVTENNFDLLYERYPAEADMKAFFKDWSARVSYLLYDAGAANADPAGFGIERP